MDSQMTDRMVKPTGILDDTQENMDSMSPFNQLSEKEFDIVLAKIGTFLYLVHNKNINPTSLFLYVMENPQIQVLLMEITSCSSLILLLKSILNRYPNLIKSKMLKNKAIKINKQLKKKNHNVH